MELTDDAKLLIKYVNEDDENNFIDILNHMYIFNSIFNKENRYLFNNQKKKYINCLRGIYYYSTGKYNKSLGLTKPYFNFSKKFYRTCEMYYHDLEKYNKALYYLNFLINKNVRFLYMFRGLFEKKNKLNKYNIYLLKYKKYELSNKKNLIYVILKK